MSTAARQVVIVQGHPDPRHRHFCHALADAYAFGARAAGHEIVSVDVACLEFPFARSREDLQTLSGCPGAIRQVQAALMRADHIVLFYPVWNGGMPAVLKGFFEQTFRTSFVFPDARPDEHLGFLSYFSQRKGLAGKSGRVVATMQMPAFVYRWYFHPHPEENTLRLSGVNPLRETFIGHVEAFDDRQRESWLSRMTALGRIAC